MRIALLLSLIVSILAAPVATVQSALHAGLTASAANECACCRSTDADRACCSQTTGNRGTPTDCCRDADCQDMSCHCPNCPCVQMLPTYFWSGCDASIPNAILETRIRIVSDSLDSICWEPLAPVPKALV